jgi:hypothetical protein
MYLAALSSSIPDAGKPRPCIEATLPFGKSKARDEVATTSDCFFAPLSRVYITLARSTFWSFASLSIEPCQQLATGVWNAPAFAINFSAAEITTSEPLDADRSF